MNIGPSVVVKGNITAGEDFSIAGRVEGEILLTGGTLMLAPGCHVAGEIAAPSVVVGGSIDGNVTATDRVDIRPGAVVAGSVKAPTLLVAEGAQLNCRVDMSQGERAKASPVVATPRVPVAV